MSATATETALLRTVRLAKDGYIHEGFAMRSGDVVEVDAAEAERLVAAGYATDVAALRIRSLRSNLFVSPTRETLAFGDERELSYEHTAWAEEAYNDHRIDIIGDPAGPGGPPRPPRPHPRAGFVTVRATRAGKLAAGIEVGAGEVRDVPDHIAADAIRSGAAVLVAGAPEAAEPPGIEVTVLRAGMIGDRHYDFGEKAVIPWKFKAPVADRWMRHEVDVKEGDLARIRASEYRLNQAHGGGAIGVSLPERRPRRPDPLPGHVRIRGLGKSAELPADSPRRRYGQTHIVGPAGGEIVDLPEADGRRLVALGLAVMVDPLPCDEGVTVPVEVLADGALSQNGRHVKAGTTAEVPASLARRLIARELVKLAPGASLPDVPAPAPGPARKGK